MQAELPAKQRKRVFCLTGLDDYRITGYPVEETDCGTVYEITVDMVYRVERESRMVFGDG